MVFVFRDKRPGLAERTPWQNICRNITVNDVSGCWEWTKSYLRGGYGWFRYKGKRVAAHRWVFESVYQIEIPDGLVVCHTCDNRSCVNPKHLFLGTQSDNIRDCVKKGRWIQAKRRRSYGD